MLEVKNKVAVITGGASGIGASLARLWVKEGGFVVIGDINEENLFKIKTELGGTNCITLKVDVRSET
ncbi:MAG: SDR family NAD(P)-dependent oxidoreductase, partial [Candidatus Omnitrophica bacterium]|nr:SDR family NAD(P)-dependent oxidoreductase [Candidatus Omnitrophota bacterium]